MRRLTFCRCHAEARWIRKTGMFVMDSSHYANGVAPDKIRIISIPWQPPVTMIVDGCWANQRPSEITMRTDERYPLALRMGTYHVWHGQLVNCANSFGE